MHFKKTAAALTVGISLLVALSACRAPAPNTQTLTGYEVIKLRRVAVMPFLPGNTALNADERILDFWVRCTHYESLHPHNAVAVVTKGVEGGYVAGAGAPVRLELSKTK